MKEGTVRAQAKTLQHKAPEADPNELLRPPPPACQLTHLVLHVVDGEREGLVAGRAVQRLESRRE